MASHMATPSYFKTSTSSTRIGAQSVNMANHAVTLDDFSKINDDESEHSGKIGGSGGGIGSYSNPPAVAIGGGCAMQAMTTSSSASHFNSFSNEPSLLFANAFSLNGIAASSSMNSSNSTSSSHCINSSGSNAESDRNTIPNNGEKKRIAEAKRNNSGNSATRSPVANMPTMTGLQPISGMSKDVLQMFTEMTSFDRLIAECAGATYIHWERKPETLDALNDFVGRDASMLIPPPRVKTLALSPSSLSAFIGVDENGTPRTPIGLNGDPRAAHLPSKFRFQHSSSAYATFPSVDASVTSPTAIAKDSASAPAPTAAAAITSPSEVSPPLVLAATPLSPSAISDVGTLRRGSGANLQSGPLPVSFSTSNLPYYSGHLTNLLSGATFVFPLFPNCATGLEVVKVLEKVHLVPESILEEGVAVLTRILCKVCPALTTTASVLQSTSGTVSSSNLTSGEAGTSDLFRLFIRKLVREGRIISSVFLSTLAVVDRLVERIILWQKHNNNNNNNNNSNNNSTTTTTTTTNNNNNSCSGQLNFGFGTSGLKLSGNASPITISALVNGVNSGILSPTLMSSQHQQQNGINFFSTSPSPSMVSSPRTHAYGGGSSLASSRGTSPPPPLHAQHLQHYTPSLMSPPPNSLYFPEGLSTLNNNLLESELVSSSSKSLCLESERIIFVGSLVVVFKLLLDGSYSLASWAELTGTSIEWVRKSEMAVLTSLGYNLPMNEFILASFIEKRFALRQLHCV